MREYSNPLYKRDTKGKPRIWTVYVEPLGDGTVKLGTESGVVGKKMTDRFVIITSGKNVGRKNATTPLEQARAEAESLVSKQLRKGYVYDLADFVRKGVMNAHMYEDHRDKLPAVVYVQPKLNGVRCKATRTEDGILYNTRGNKFFTHIPDRITEALMIKMEIGEEVDGEFYIPNVSLRKINSALKAYNPEFTPRLQFHIFDIATDNGETFARRYTKLERGWGPWWALNGAGLFLVETHLVCHGAELQQLYHKWLEIGYEGLMARNPYAPYAPGIRSYDLQKLKPVQDGEFEIVEITIDREGMGMPVCITPGGVRFEVRLMGATELRRDMAENPIQYMSKMLTVHFQELLDSGIPQFARGEFEESYIDDDEAVVRDYE